MSLLNDLHHMTFVTGDLDRLIAFDERKFDGAWHEIMWWQMIDME